MTAQANHPFTGRHMLSIMLAFFATVFAANMSLVYFASHSWTGLVVKNSYVASQEFNKTTQRLEKAAADFHAALTYQNGKLSISLTDNSGQPASGGNMKATLGRPSHEGEDQNITLLGRGNGVYIADHVLAKGQWSGTATADLPQHQTWMRPIRILVKD
jgi:nitrogen fixation protein FixH